KQLDISWHDPTWNPLPNKDQILDYFSGRSNPFYDRTCNNETIRMQRLNRKHVMNMVGLEYILLHEQQPILYVIRKQRRHSPKQVTTIADYYVIAGVAYQAPDLASMCNSRLVSGGCDPVGGMTMFHHLDSAFTQALSYSRYHPAKGYTWNFNEHNEEKKKKTPDAGSMFQINRVDTLLASLTQRFPHTHVQQQDGGKPTPIEPAKKVEKP
uniref:Mediator of RNA polymerase II transcription subunit 6 n=1 Tax=Ciona savignyi TaxID=51511 RepID=H2Y616_CIOSA